MTLRLLSTVAAPEYYANSGYPQDIQNAVDEATPTGGDVFIPAGTFNWNGETVRIPTGVNVFGASSAGCMGHESNWASYTATTILHNQAKSNPMFKIDGTGRTDKSGRIANIQFELDASLQSVGNEGGTGIIVYRGVDYRIDHCTFLNFGGVAVFVDNSDDNFNRVLIDHSVVDNPYKLSGSGWSWGYGFSVRSAVQGRDSGFQPYTDAYWGDATEIYGKWETAPSRFGLMYVEDCHFSRCRHSTVNIQGGFYVVRYSLFDNPYPHNFGMIDHHGTGSSVGGTVISYIGGRGFEAYENTIIGKSGYYANAGIWQRGGSSIVFNNKFINDYNSQYNIFDFLANDDSANLYPLTHVNQTYIWNNTVTNGVAISHDAAYTENVDYFLRAPNQAQDGFTYTPYVYPHPLISGAAPPPSGPVTPYTQSLTAGTYKITIPAQAQVDTDIYNFKQWEDGSTNPVRTINLTIDTTITAEFEKATVKLSGTVIDKKTRNPLSEVKITANSYTTMTQPDGTFVLDLLPGIYTITFEKAGYLTTEATGIDLTEGDWTFPESIQLTPIPPIPLWKVGLVLASIILPAGVIAYKRKEAVK